MRPLEGKTVLSLEHAVAAPFCTRQLADYGARVLKIERPGSGDFARGYDETVHGLSSHFVWLNRGKESITLDLKHEEAREVLEKLVARADVLVQNLAPGAAARAGLDYATLAPKHPRLVVADISGYGDSGPYRDKKAYDTLVQAEAGLIGITGGPDEPSRCGISVADIAAGMYAYAGILTALLQRERTGRGTRVEVSMLEALVEWMGYPIYFSRYGGKAPRRTGATHPSIAPYGPHRAGDGGQVILGLQNEREWETFCAEVLGRTELARDPRFSSNSARVAHREELTRIIEDAFAGLSTDAAVRLLDDVRGCAVDEGGAPRAATAPIGEDFAGPRRRPRLPRERLQSAHRPRILARQRRAEPIDEEILRLLDDGVRDLGPPEAREELAELPRCVDSGHGRPPIQIAPHARSASMRAGV